MEISGYVTNLTYPLFILCPLGFSLVFLRSSFGVVSEWYRSGNGEDWVKGSTTEADVVQRKSSCLPHRLEFILHEKPFIS
jgi:hypothetical protein